MGNKHSKLLVASASASPSAIARPRGTSHLLGLPRELRDQIYTHVFSQTPMILSWQTMHLLVSLSCLVPNINTRIKLKYTPKGLPSWLRACSQILHETAEFITRTHTFQPFTLQAPKEKAVALSNPPNPLIFSPTITNTNNNNNNNNNSTRIRKIALCNLLKLTIQLPNNLTIRRMDLACSPKTSTLFLQTLKSTTPPPSTKDLELEIHWERGLHNCRYPRSKDDIPLFFFDPEDVGQWEGRFRKVMVEMTVLDEVSMEETWKWLMPRAVRLARRLVGEQGKGRWHEVGQGWVPEGLMGYESRRVVVERRVG